MSKRARRKHKSANKAGESGSVELAVAEEMGIASLSEILLDIPLRAIGRIAGVAAAQGALLHYSMPAAIAGFLVIAGSVEIWRRKRVRK